MTRFDRDKRLLTAHQFKRVFQRSRRFQDQLLMLRVRYSRETQPRLGLAISKKHARLAVQRNRIKRQVREVFRTNYDALAAGDYVILNRPAAATASRQALSESVAALLKQAAKTKSPQ